MHDAIPEPERWLPVVGFEAYYEVSDLGRVRGLKRGLILKPSFSNSGGYGLVILSDGLGGRFGRYVHRLVLEAFVGPCPPGQECRHVDDNDPRNARLDNLCWGTSGANKSDQVRHGTHPEASRDHCDNGHEFTEANTYIAHWPDGSFKQRSCRACHNDATKARRQERLRSGVPCTEDGCAGPQLAKGLCEKHYQRQWRVNRT